MAQIGVAQFSMPSPTTRFTRSGGNAVILMKRMRRAILSCLPLAAVSVWSHAATAIASEPSVRPPTILIDPLETFVPARRRDWADEARLVAEANFAEAQLLLRRGKRHAALDKLERAARYDPASRTISRQLIALASRLERRDEATRYAVFSTDHLPVNADRLTRLAALLVNRGDTERAIGLFERALEAHAEDAHLAKLALRVELGRLHLLRDRPHRAAEYFMPVQKVLDDPARFYLTDEEIEKQVKRPLVLYALMGECFLQAGKPAAAESILQRLQEAEPNEARWSLHRARIAAEKEDWETASEALDRFFELGQVSPSVTPYELLRDVVHQQVPQPAAAEQRLLDRLRELRMRSPEHAPLGYFLADRLMQAGADHEAIDLYRNLLAQRPTTLAATKLIQLYARQDLTGEMLELLQQQLRISGSLAPLRAELTPLAQDPDRFSQIRTELGEASTEEAKLLGILLAILGGHHDQAETWYQQYEADGGNPAAREQIGLAWFLADEPARAAATFDELILRTEEQAKLAEYYYYRASALALAGETDQAVRDADRAAALSDEPRFASRSAWILYYAKRFEEASERYRQFLERFERDYRSTDLRSVIRDARLILSNIYVEQQRRPEAEEQLERVLDEFPEDVGAANDLGYLWADQGKYLERALAMVQEAVAKAPENRAYRDSLGWALYRLGRYQEAVRELEKAASQEQPDGVILDHLGDAYWKVKRKTEALHTWRAAQAALAAEGEDDLAERVEAKILDHQE